MSELKATTIYDAYWKANSVGEGTGVLVYLKSEADTIIAELKAEINRKEGVETRWFERCMEARAENVRLKNHMMSLARKTNHSDYKRCLAMAKLCKCKRFDAADYRIPRKKWEFYDKWYKRWLELAKQFKEERK